MKTATILPTANLQWGFWGTSIHNGYDADMTWAAVSRFLAAEFDLTAEQVRDVLDARFGRHLADDLSFIEGDLTEASIAAHLRLRLADSGWHDSFRKSIRDITGKLLPRKAPPTKEQIFATLAQKHLGIETLATRNSDELDFHNVAVWSIKDALEAAFEAGKAQK